MRVGVTSHALMVLTRSVTTWSRATRQIAARDDLLGKALLVRSVGLGVVEYLPHRRRSAVKAMSPISSRGLGSMDGVTGATPMGSKRFTGGVSAAPRNRIRFDFTIDGIRYRPTIQRQHFATVRYPAIRACLP